MSETPQGYQGPLPAYYLQSTTPQTPNLGLTIAGMDPILAYNLVLIDTAVGSGSSTVNVNSAPVSNPNFNGTTPAAPANNTNVTFQVSGSDVSAYIPTVTATTPASPNTSVQFNNSGAFGGDSSFTWNNSTKELSLNASGAFLNIGSATHTVSSTSLEIHATQGYEAIFSHGGSSASAIDLFRSNGTQASPTAITSGQFVSFLGFGGYDSSSYVETAYFFVQASENFTPIAHGTNIQVNATRIGQTGVSEVFRFGSGTSARQINLSSVDLLAMNGIVLGWSSAANALANTGFSRLANNSAALGNGTAGDFTGTLKLTILNAVTGVQINGAATSANVLRGDGTNFVSAKLSIGDLSTVAGGTILGNSTGSTTAPSATAVPVLGIPGTTSGTLGIANGGGSGQTITIQNLGATGAYNFNLPTTVGSPGQVLTSQGGGSTSMTWATIPGTGTVTSVALATGAGAADALYTITGSPVTTSGTITETLNTQSANVIFAGPTSGGAATPTFRSLVAADLPAGATLWSALGNAAGALTLSNGTNATTFNQTNATTWTWANTTPTVVSLVLTQVSVSGATTTYTGTITGGGSNAYAGASVTFAGFVNGTNNGTFVITASTTTTLVVTTVSQVNETHAGTAVSSAAVTSPIHSFNSTYTTGSASATDSWTIQNVLSGVAANGQSTLTLAHSGSTGRAVLQAPQIGVNTSSLSLNGSSFASVIFKAANTAGTSCYLASESDTGHAGILLNCSSNSANTRLWGIETTSADIFLISPFSDAGSGTTKFSITRAGLVTITNTISSYSGTATVGQGIPSEIGTAVDLTAQSAAIAATNIIASAPRSGMYRISWTATITTAASTSSVLGGTNGFQVVYTSPTDSVAKTTVAGASVTSSANTTATATSGTLIVYAKTATAIQYQFDYTSVGVTPMSYELHVRLEAM